MQTIKFNIERLISKSNILLILLFSLIFFSAPSIADESNYADFNLHLTRECIGENCKFSTEEPTAVRPKNWVAQNDPPIQNEYYALSSWEMNIGGPVELGDYHNGLIWVESTNVQEISIYATLFVSWIDYSEDPSDPQSRVTNISEVEFSKSSQFGQVLNGNYTIEYENAVFSNTGDFPKQGVIPAYSTLGYKVETKIRWAPDTANNTAWIKSDSNQGCENDDSPTACDSFVTLNIRPVEIDEDVGNITNNRVDEVNEDYLEIKIRVTNALGADNFDMDSAELAIQGVSNGGKFQNSIVVVNRGPYSVRVEGDWYYQEDRDIISNIYSIEISIKDIDGNIWKSEVDYDLVVDEFGLEIEFSEPYSSKGQLPKGGETDYEFKVFNRGNTRDIFEITLDSSDLPSGWLVSLLSPETLDLTSNQHDTVRLVVEAPVSARGGSSESIDIEVQSVSSSIVRENIKLETTVREYGVSFASTPEEVIIDPEEIDSEGFYRFEVNIRNTGSDKDTFSLAAAISGWPEPAILGDEGTQVPSITLGKSQMAKLTIQLKPVNYEDTYGEAKVFNLAANSISPGDGSASIKIDIIVDIPVERVIDLSVNSEDILVNNKPLSLVSQDDLPAEEPIKIQVLLTNNGGKSTGAFEVKLYVGQRVEDEFIVEQGVRGFGTETVILTWSSPYTGPMTLRIKVDGNFQTDEIQSKRSDNIVTLSLNVGNKDSSSNGKEDSDDSLLFSPSYLVTFLVLSLVSVISRKKY